MHSAYRRRRSAITIPFELPYINENYPYSIWSKHLLKDPNIKG